MKKTIKAVLVLASISAFAAVILAFFNQLTEKRIEKNELYVLETALKKVSSGYEIGEKSMVSETEYVKAFYPLLKENLVNGYILDLVSNGYGGEMTIIASYAMDGTVINAELVSDSETPGVGKKAENKAYMDKFLGKGSETNPIPLLKSSLSSEDVVTVSGATITFTGISKALNAGSSFVRNLVN